MPLQYNMLGKSSTVATLLCHYHAHGVSNTPNLTSISPVPDHVYHVCLGSTSNPPCCSMCFNLPSHSHIHVPYVVTRSNASRQHNMVIGQPPYHSPTDTLSTQTLYYRPTLQPPTMTLDKRNYTYLRESSQLW